MDRSAGCEERLALNFFSDCFGDALANLTKLVDLPVEQATFAQVVNQKAPKSPGLTKPQLLLRGQRR
jgi:hypothetical protein